MTDEEVKETRDSKTTSLDSKVGSKANLVKSQNFGSRNNLRSKASLALSKSNLSKYASKERLNNKRDSIAPLQQQANAIVYENTYRMKPELKFGAGAVGRIVDEVLKKHLTKVKYDHEKIPELICAITNETLQEIKKLNYDRYKVVVQVDIGEMKGQGIRVASRCVWDTTTDTWASGSFKNASLWAVAMVFGCYFE